MSEWIERHQSCDECGSSDGRSVNDRGWSTCFVCDHTFKQEDGLEDDNEQAVHISTDTLLSEDTFNRLANAITSPKGIPDRGLTPVTVAKYGVAVANARHIYPYRDLEEGEVVAVKRRLPDKSAGFPTEGPISKTQLFGQHLFPGGGRKLVITEGETDAMAVHQMQGSKYPAVSVQSSTYALRHCKLNYEYIDSFDEVIVCFDADKAGDKAALLVAELFSGKSKVMRLGPKGYNDPVDCILDGQRGVERFQQSFWDAETFTPPGIIAGTDMWDLVNSPLPKCNAEYPWDGLNATTRGIRWAELVTIAAGSGLGKSQICREILHNLLETTKDNIAGIFLEEGERKTGLSIMSLASDIPMHLEDSTEAQRKAAFDQTLGTGRIFLTNNGAFGNAQLDTVLSRVRYFAKAHECKYVFIDHLGMITGGKDGDERKLIDEAMTELRTLVQELNITVFLVSHLKRPDGKGHEEGGQVSLAQLRGSGAIAHLSDICIGGERNGQAEDPRERNTTRLRILKNRFSGETGLACALLYDKETGRLSEIEDEATTPLTKLEEAL